MGDADSVNKDCSSNSNAGERRSVPIRYPRLLEEIGFHKRRAEMTKTMGDTPFHNEQSENIAQRKRRHVRSPNPIISMDRKKKSFWANSSVPVGHGTHTSSMGCYECVVFASWREV